MPGAVPVPGALWGMAAGGVRLPLGCTRGDVCIRDNATAGRLRGENLGKKGGRGVWGGTLPAFVSLCCRFVFPGSRTAVAGWRQGGSGAAGAVPAVAGAHSPSCTSVASRGSEASHLPLQGCCFKNISVKREFCSLVPLKTLYETKCI